MCHIIGKEIELAEDAVKADVSRLAIEKEVVGNHALGIMNFCGLFFFAIIDLQKTVYTKSCKTNKYSNLTHNGEAVALHTVCFI